MTSDPDPQLAARMDAALKALPPVAAPPELARQVMGVLAARAARPWWRRAWWDWPAAARAALVSAAAVLIMVLAGSTTFLNVDASGVSRQLGDRIVAGYPGPVEALMNAAHVLWDRAVEPQILYLGSGFVLLYLLCIGLGTAFVRLALKRA